MSWWVWVIIIVVAVLALGANGGVLGIHARLNSMDPPQGRVPEADPRVLSIARGNDHAP
jgi:hypothetical protein